MQIFANSLDVNDVPLSVRTFVGHECLVTNIFYCFYTSAVKVFNGTASGQQVNTSIIFNKYLYPSGEVLSGLIMSIATISKG
jgi:hypothetical protein